MELPIEIPFMPNCPRLSAIIADNNKHVMAALSATGKEQLERLEEVRDATTMMRLDLREQELEAVFDGEDIDEVICPAKRLITAHLVLSCAELSNKITGPDPRMDMLRRRAESKIKRLTLLVSMCTQHAKTEKLPN